ncbi:MAG: STAS domain-containing protein [Symploca sp. SIO2E6]|nr:STAS domain-containing protein [Symploca sp. SIO2E6]
MVKAVSEESFQVTFLEHALVMHLPARVSVTEGVAFKEKCQQLLDGSSLPEKIVLDCSQTIFIDSSGIGALARTFRNTQQKEVQLVLKDVTPQVMAVLELTSLDQVLTLEPPAATATTTAYHSEKQLPTTHPSVGCRIKRFLDMLGSVVGLAITAMLFIPIAIAIKLDSPGPIFFGQTRCGLMARKFTMWKFRSMCADAEAQKSSVPNQAIGAIFKNDNDPRVTKVGRFLRKTSLDELPQFWNVLQGDMSLVGTRPPTPKEVEYYEVPEWRRLDVKPGMTGEWQVNGRSSIKNFEDIIELDLQYQHNWSLTYDLKLIFKTIIILFNENSGAV